MPPRSRREHAALPPIGTRSTQCPIPPQPPSAAFAAPDRAHSDATPITVRDNTRLVASVPSHGSIGARAALCQSATRRVCAWPLAPTTLQTSAYWDSGATVD